MTAHTPERWWLDEGGPFPLGGDDGREFYAINRGTFDEPSEERVADVYTTESDARLIVSAPDLLEALRVLTAFAAAKTCGVTPEEWALLVQTGDGIPRVVADGRAAIARAEGRAP